MNAPGVTALEGPQAEASGIEATFEFVDERVASRDATVAPESAP
jgi:hypothetical protein